MLLGFVNFFHQKKYENYFFLIINLVQQRNIENLEFISWAYHVYFNFEPIPELHDHLILEINQIQILKELSFENVNSFFLKLNFKQSDSAYFQYFLDLLSDSQITFSQKIFEINSRYSQSSIDGEMIVRYFTTLDPGEQETLIYEIALTIKHPQNYQSACFANKNFFSGMSFDHFKSLFDINSNPQIEYFSEFAQYFHFAIFSWISSNEYNSSHIEMFLQSILDQSPSNPESFLIIQILNSSFSNPQIPSKFLEYCQLILNNIDLPSFFQYLLSLHSVQFELNTWKFLHRDKKISFTQLLFLKCLSKFLRPVPSIDLLWPVYPLTFQPTLELLVEQTNKIPKQMFNSLIPLVPIVFQFLTPRSIQILVSIIPFQLVYPKFQFVCEKEKLFYYAYLCSQPFDISGLSLRAAQACCSIDNLSFFQPVSEISCLNFYQHTLSINDWMKFSDNYYPNLLTFPPSSILIYVFFDENKIIHDLLKKQFLATGIQKVKIIFVNEQTELKFDFCGYILWKPKQFPISATKILDDLMQKCPTVPISISMNVAIDFELEKNIKILNGINYISKNFETLFWNFASPELLPTGDSLPMDFSNELLHCQNYHLDNFSYVSKSLLFNHNIIFSCVFSDKNLSLFNFDFYVFEEPENLLHFIVAKLTTLNVMSLLTATPSKDFIEK